jgi:hypothetical protein
MERMERKKLELRFVWDVRLKLRAEGNKLYAEGDKLRAEGNKLWAEGNKLCAEGDKLRAEGDKLWAEAILECYGNIKLEWKNYNSEKHDFECHLETGEIFKPVIV